MLILIISLSGCATTVSNINSFDDLSGSKLLVGRFIFYDKGKRVEPYYKAAKHDVARGPSLREKRNSEEDNEPTARFKVLFKKGTGKAKKFE